MYDQAVAVEQKLRQAEVAGRRQIVLTSGRGTKTSQADIDEFRRRVREDSETVAERAEARLVKLLTPRERRFNDLCFRFIDEALWMLSDVKPGFPDGKPLNTQSQHHLDLWAIFMGAVQRRENKVMSGHGVDD